MDEPEIIVGSMPWRFSARMTPKWAKPRARPLPSARPMRGGADICTASAPPCVLRPGLAGGMSLPFLSLPNIQNAPIYYVYLLLCLLFTRGGEETKLPPLNCSITRFDKFLTTAGNSPLAKPSSTAAPAHTASWPLIRRVLREYVRPYLGALLLAILLMLLAAAMTGAMAKLMEPIIDKVFTEQNRDILLPVAFSVMGVFVVRGIATYAHTVMMNRLAQRVIADMQRDMFGHLVYADLAFFHGQQSGTLLSRFISDVNQIRAALIQCMTSL